MAGIWVTIYATKDKSRTDYMSLQNVKDFTISLISLKNCSPWCYASVQQQNYSYELGKLNAVKPLFTNIRYNDKFRYNKIWMEQFLSSRWGR